MATPTPILFPTDSAAEIVDGFVGVVVPNLFPVIAVFTLMMGVIFIVKLLNNASMGRFSTKSSGIDIWNFEGSPENKGFVRDNPSSLAKDEREYYSDGGYYCGFSEDCDDPNCYGDHRG